MLKLENKCENEIVNIGQKDYKIKYFANIICKIIEYPFDKLYLIKKNL